MYIELMQQSNHLFVESFRYCLYKSATSTADIQSINDDDNDDDSVTHADNAIRIVRVTFATCWLLLCAVRDLLSPLQRMPFAVCCVMRTSCIVIHTRCSCTKPIAGPVETTLATPPPKKPPNLLSRLRGLIGIKFI